MKRIPFATTSEIKGQTISKIPLANSEIKGQTISKIPLAKITLPPHHHSMRTSLILGEGRFFYHVTNLKFKGQTISKIPL